MTNPGYDQFAEALVFVHGVRAEAEAARHEELCTRAGDRRAARLWRMVQFALRDRELPQAA